MFKRLLSLTLAIVLLFCLVSCKKGYESVPSSEQELTTVMKMGDFEIKYELFRTFFLTNKSSIDGGDRNVWISDKASEYRAEAIELILPQIAEIYAMFAMCESYGIEVFSEEMDAKVQQYVDVSVDGGMIGDSIISGFASYEEYLEYLKSMYMNDSVSRLLIRYSLCEELLREKFLTETKATKEDVEEFFFGDECAHITWLNILYEGTEYLGSEDMRNLADKAHARLKTAKNQREVINTLVQYSAGASASQIENGFYIGKYTLDSAYMQEIIDAAFTLKAGEFSQVIENYYGLYIIYVMNKNASYLETESNYEEIEELYLNNKFYYALSEYKASLLKGVKYTDFFNSLNFAEIEYK